MKKNGLFITVEGGEGVGKSTQSRLLFETLKKQGIDVLLTREPGGSVGGEEIRHLLVNGSSDRWDSVTELLLFMAARRDHLVKKIWPALANGQVVICDRFLDSTLAYQGYGYGKNENIIHQIRSVYHLIAGDFMPDITFVLDLPAEEGVRRSQIRMNNTEQRFESMDLSFHNNLRIAFQELAEKDSKHILIDASQSVEKIHDEILEHVRSYLK